jgi:outer membrane protein assembly factor BamB
MRPSCATFPLILLLAAPCAGAEWPRFRGPNGSGLAGDAGLPVSWSATENVVWKTPLPGPGSSSPVVAGDRIFVTCYSGYGLLGEKPGRPENLAHHVIGLDRKTGALLWDRRIPSRLANQPYRGFVALHGYASSSPVADDRAVYAFFGHSGVWAFDVDGKPLWNVRVGDETHRYGTGASPIRWRDLLIVNASVESQSLVALDAATGRVVWRVGEIVDSWGTPAIATLSDGAQELAVALHGKTLGLDPANGAALWECASVEYYVVPSAVACGDVIYVTGGRGNVRTTAIRAGGRGDVTRTRVLWEINKSPQVPTPIICGGLLYWVDKVGKAVCLNAKTGEVVYEQDLALPGRDDKVYASLVFADGRLYGVSRQAGVFVLAAGSAFKLLARNDVGDRSGFHATPAVSGGRLLLRSDRAVHCIGK